MLQSQKLVQIKPLGMFLLFMAFPSRKFCRLIYPIDTTERELYDF